MKKGHVFTFVITVILIGILLKINNTNGNHIVAIAVSIIVYIIILIGYYSLFYANREYGNLYHLDPYLSIVKVKDVQKDKIGLVPWGYTENGLGDIEDYFTYYYISEIPEELRKKGAIFKIEREEFNVIFKKIKLNKTSFEILNDHVYIA